MECVHQKPRGIQRFVQPGQRGRVMEYDRDSDSLIEFEAMDERRWPTESFDKLELIESHLARRSRQLSSWVACDDDRPPDALLVGSSYDPAAIQIRYRQRSPHAALDSKGLTQADLPALLSRPNDEDCGSLGRTESTFSQLSPQKCGSSSAHGDTIASASAASLAASVAEPRSVFDQHQLREIFDLCDRHGSGSISRGSLIRTLRESAEVASFLGLPQRVDREDMSFDTLEAFFNEVDVDQNRAIDWTEFQNYFAIAA